MAKPTQAAKRHRQSLKRRERNYAYRSRLRTSVKKARLAIAEDSEDKEEQVQAACRELDRMVTKGVIHKNTAARRKSRLMAALHGGLSMEMVAEDEVEEVVEEEETEAEDEGED